MLGVLRNRYGVWRRAGVDGLLSGIDMTEAVASLPKGCDVEFARALLMAAEAGYMAGHIEKRVRDKGTK